jgi:4-aminobutyrate aminotransferase-like enzyme
VAEQMRQLNTNTRYLQEASVELAERLLQAAPGGLDRVLFVNSGSEANDVAWRIARFATGSSGALVTRFAYHGVTEATSDFSPEGWPPGFSPEHVRLLPPPFRADRSEPDNGTARNAQTAREIDLAVEDLTGRGIGLAALFLDPAFTSDGIFGPSNRWVQQAAAAIRAGGGLFVADEVQAGYGRTGDDLWSITPSGVDPDVMTLGKPMGNGFPIAAVITRSDIVDGFMEATDYFSTFGGNTVACAAGLAVLRVVEEEGLVSNAQTVGAYLLHQLEEVAARHDSIGQVRGWGMLTGIDIVHGESRQPDGHGADAIANALKDLGVLVGTTGSKNNVLKIRPPLVFNRRNADVVAERLDLALSKNYHNVPDA